MFIAELTDADLASSTWTRCGTGIMAGSPCPVEVMKRVIDDYTARGGHLLRHDGDVAGLDADARRRLAERAVGSRRPAGPHIEVKVVDPATGRSVPRGEPGELCTVATA